jgi:MFS family permease
MSAREFSGFLLAAFLGIFGAAYLGAHYGRRGAIAGLILGLVTAGVICTTIWFLLQVWKRRKSKKR